jgi:hypothetical protein
VDLLFRRPNRNKESGTVGGAAGVSVGGNALAEIESSSVSVSSELSDTIEHASSETVNLE